MVDELDIVVTLEKHSFVTLFPYNIVATLEKHKSIQFCIFKTENNFKVAAIKKT